jgi:Tol biopolymer transport system component
MIQKIILLLLVLFSIDFVIAQNQEKHLQNMRQLTFGGDNAEAYFNGEGNQLIFQSNNPAWGLECDHIFLMDIEKAADNPEYMPNMISNGQGRTTCSYFMPMGMGVLYASTHEGGISCPHVPNLRRDGKYLWPIFDTYNIYIASEDGQIIRKLTDDKGYDAEATVSPDGEWIVFTSMRSGDLELWLIKPDGSGLRQVTDRLGYCGGAFFSPDSKKLVFRASIFSTEQEKEEYQTLLKEGLVAPTNMELFVCDIDGSNLIQVTNLGKANWAPFFHPSGEKLLFSSNHHSESGWDFQLFMINIDGTDLKQITFESRFNAFPMFSPDGKKLVFSSNRNNGGTRDTNIFIADWVD